jgi:hypothetical protein
VHLLKTARALSGAVAIGVSMAAVPLGVIPASASSSALSTYPPQEIISIAQAAMAKESSVSAHGHAILNIRGTGKVSITQTDYSGTNSGSQVLTLRSVKTGSGAGLPSLSARAVNGALFINATSTFWSASAGLTASQAKKAANRWIQVPMDSRLYGPAIADLTTSSLTHNLFEALNYHRAKVKKVDGVQTVPITYTNTGPDAGAAICYISLSGRNLPVAVDIAGLTLNLSAWGVQKTVSVPPNPTSLDTITTPTT